MFENVIVDITTTPDDKTCFYETIDPRETKLFPFIYLIAENVFEASEDESFKHKNQPDFIKQSLTSSQGRPNILDYVKDKNKGVLFTAATYLKAYAIKEQGLTSENCILILAAAGLDITIPGFTLDIARSEEVVNIKEQLTDERMEYIHSITKMADETFDRLHSGVYKDTVDWALNEAYIKIKPKAEKFSKSIQKLDGNILRRASFAVLEDGIPAIGSSIVAKGFSDIPKQSIEIVLKILCKNLSKSIEERKVPEVVYGYKIARQLK
jgi:hypothetical protein